MEAKSEGNGERKGKSRAACDSGRKGDYRYKSCAPFCKEVNGKSHCTFCKCMTCSFCINPNASTSSSSLARARNKEPLVPTSLASSAKEHKEELQASLQDYRRSTGSGPLVASLQAALRESELRVSPSPDQLPFPPRGGQIETCVRVHACTRLRMHKCKPTLHADALSMTLV